VRHAHSSHFLEHIDDVPGLIAELARVVRIGGSVDVIVPHFSNPYYYSDLTHRSFFGLYTFCYLARCDLFRREVSGYDTNPPFQVEDVKLRFMSPRPFIVRHCVKRSVQAVVNRSRWLQEFYEENMAQIFPCYDIHFSLRRTAP
jgi:ubiquinone/menaquinone biosynthesis C-methylase UbiE